MVKRGVGGSLYTAWGFGFGAAALIMAGISLFHLIALPRFGAARVGVAKASQAASDFIHSFSEYLGISRQRATVALATGFFAAIVVMLASFLVLHKPVQAFAYGIVGFLIVLTAQARPVVALSLAFIMFYKIGDEIIFSMGTPFLKRYLLVSNIQFAWMTGLLGLLGSIAGTSIGGLWIKKTGLKKAIWPLTLLMNVNIWAYVWLAWYHPLASTTGGLLVIGAVYAYEQIAAGLGNAVLIVYILRTCKPEFKAGHYAIGSAFMSIFSTVFGGFGGIIVEKTGYLNLFLIGFFATIPAMLLLFRVPIHEDT
jgi:PAT family beta-lactamase induction signal transducer AmpG